MVKIGTYVMVRSHADAGAAQLPETDLGWGVSKTVIPAIYRRKPPCSLVELRDSLLKLIASVSKPRHDLVLHANYFSVVVRRAYCLI